MLEVSVATSPVMPVVQRGSTSDSVSISEVNMMTTNALAKDKPDNRQRHTHAPASARGQRASLQTHAHPLAKPGTNRPASNVMLCTLVPVSLHYAWTKAVGATCSGNVSEALRDV